ncbi:MAG: DUF2147 domain-containing protein [Comamonadaceae bacterium]|nr:MAG: DUF2147 domain-containing protein [Comamonadaceae bacterium]
MFDPRHAFALTLCVCLSAPVYAGPPTSPVGLWKTFNDANQATGLIRITDSAGVISGKVEKILIGDPAARCAQCPADDPRKDKPIVGMTVLKDMKKEGDIYSGGTILKAGDGTIAKAEIRVVDGGQKIEMKGSVGIFSRTLTWVRAE